MRWISITIFLFLIIIVPITSATNNHDGTGQFTSDGTIVDNFYFETAQNVPNDYVTTIMFNDIDTAAGVSIVKCRIPAGIWIGGDSISMWGQVDYRVDSPTGEIVATGTFGYNKGYPDYYAIAFFDEDTDLTNGGTHSGSQAIYITGNVMPVKMNRSGSNSEMKGTRFTYAPIDTTTPTLAYMVTDDGDGIWRVPAWVDHETTTIYNFENTYTYDQAYNSLDFTLDKSETSISSVIIENNGGHEIINESSLNYVDIDLQDWDIANITWTVQLTNAYSNIFTDTISFMTTSAGSIVLNQTSYTEPELIQMDIELTTYDFTDHSYYIITEVREDEGSWDNVAGTYNGTTKITTATATKILDIDTWLYDLPLWVRVKLVDYNKISGEYSTIYTTGMVRYNAPTPDSIKFGGTVINADTNEIISGATVSVDGVTTASDTTNAFGEFLIYLYPGIYTVTTSKTGYQTSTSEDLLMEFDNTWAQIYLTPIGYGNGTLYGNVNDADTGYAIKDVHVIITNATDQIDAYTSSGGYYEATGLAQSSTYTIQAVKSGYYTYNGSVTTEASGASHKSFNMVLETVTPTPTATVLPTTTYPGGEGHEWTNDEIVTMLRVIVPGFFLLMLVFLLLAVMLGLSGNNGNNGQGRSGLGELWRR